MLATSFLWGNGGNAKLHDLYLVWLSAKGVWEKATLHLSIRNDNVNTQQTVYHFVELKDLIAQYGEELAQDLVRRHKEAESKLPASQKGMYIKASLC